MNLHLRSGAVLAAGLTVAISISAITLTAIPPQAPPGRDRRAAELFDGRTPFREKSSSASAALRTWLVSEQTPMQTSAHRFVREDTAGVGVFSDRFIAPGIVCIAIVPTPESCLVDSTNLAL